MSATPYEYFKPHGNWEGMSLGWTIAVWLAHILSEGDHRMNQMQTLRAVSREQEGGQQEQITEGYEHSVTPSSNVDWRMITWMERHLIIRSHKLAKALRPLLVLAGYHWIDVSFVTDGCGTALDRN